MVRYLISTRGVFEVSIKELGEKTTRAFERMLVDYEVVLTNVEDPKDCQRGVAVVSREFFDDFDSLKLHVDLYLLVLRFFAGHFESDLLEELSSYNGPALLHSNYETYLGIETAESEADSTVRSRFRDAVRAKADIKISIEDLFVSTDLQLGTIQRSLNFLVAAGELEETDGLYQTKHLLLSRVEVTDNSPSLWKDKPESTTLHLLDLENDELYYLSYEFGSPWDYGRVVDIKFSLNNSNNALIYENYIGIDFERKEEDLEPALRFFLHLYKSRSPTAENRGDILLFGEQRDEYQFPESTNGPTLTVKVLEALESFASYKPVEGLSILELMISIDVNQQSLLRAINRLTAREIVKSTGLAPRYAIADYDRKDSYIRKYLEKTVNSYIGKERNSQLRRSVTCTVQAFNDVSSPGQDGVSYELIYEAVDSDLVGTPEKSASTKHGVIGISGSRSLKRKWGLNSDDYKKVLFEIAKRKLKASVNIENYDLQPINLHTRNSPSETPYDPQRISIIINESYEVELRRANDREASQVKWDAFICHASEDKEAFVRPLAGALQLKGLEIWYDEITLRVGDSLRRRIDEGLAHSRHGIVVLSPSFFEKEWPQMELDGLFQKEVEGEKVILPVWHNVNVEDVRNYSVILADRVGVSSSKGLEHVVEELLKAMQYDQSKKILK